MRTSTIHTILYELQDGMNAVAKLYSYLLVENNFFFKNVFIIDLIRREYQILLQSLQ